MSGLTFIREQDEDANQRTLVVRWLLVPVTTNIGIHVNAQGVKVGVNGELAFDNRQEQQDWALINDMAVLAWKYIKQGSRVPSDNLLMQQVAAARRYEEDSP